MSGGRDQAEDTARETRDHPVLEGAARVGMFAYGVVYLIVAWLAGHLALGDPAGSASGSGALKEVAQQPLGSVALWLAAGGFAALVVWEVCQAIGGHRSEKGVRRWAGRSGSAGRAVVFGVLAVLAVRTVTGGGGSDGGGAKGITAEVMSRPLGTAMVVAIGAGIAVVGVVSIHKAVTDRWRKELDAEGQTGAVSGPVAVLARAGYLSRGVAFLVLAGLFAWAGLTHDADKSGGLDQAIVRFRDEPYGPWLILVIAAGLACYGGFHLARACFLRGS